MNKIFEENYILEHMLSDSVRIGDLKNVPTSTDEVSNRSDKSENSDEAKIPPKNINFVPGHLSMNKLLK